MQDYSDIVLKLCDLLGSFNKDEVELSENTDLVADLGLDSLKVVELLVSVEDTFDIFIPLNVLPQVRTIRDFAQRLQQLLSEGV